MSLGAPRSLPLAWEVLRRAVNAEPALMRTAGVRDSEAVCEAFDGNGYNGRGQCMSDGHYLCTECSELSPEAYRFTEYGRAGRRDRLLLFWRRPGRLLAVLTLLLVTGCRTVAVTGGCRTVYDPLLDAAGQWPIRCECARSVVVGECRP